MLVFSVSDDSEVGKKLAMTVTVAAHNFSSSVKHSKVKSSHSILSHSALLLNSIPEYAKLRCVPRTESLVKSGL